MLLQLLHVRPLLLAGGEHLQQNLHQALRQVGHTLQLVYSRVEGRLIERVLNVVVAVRQRFQEDDFKHTHG